MRHCPTRWIAGLLLVCSLGLFGCVTIGRPIDRLARATDIPLVAVPPPPFGRSDSSAPPPPTSPLANRSESPTPPPPTSPPLVPPPEETKTDTPPPARIVPTKSDSSPEPTAPTIRDLLKKADANSASLHSYIVRLTRREKVGDKHEPEELILFKFRKRPWGVHFKWLFKPGEENRDGVGREVVYVKGKYDDKIHTRLGRNDMLLMPAGRRIALGLNNPLVRSSTRHPISEAGIAASIERLSAFQTAIEKGEKKQGELIVRARVDRPEFSTPVTAIDHVIPAGFDPTLPKGGTRTYYFDGETNLPMLLQAHENGKEVEYYRYDRLQAEVQLDDADFDPDQLWGKPQAQAAK